MSKIVKIIGREIIDSRGNPTVEAEVHLEGGFVGMAAARQVLLLVPVKLWNCAMATNPVSSGKGVTKAVAAVNGPIAQALIGKDAKDQAGIDKIMIDWTAPKTNPNSARTQSRLYLWLTPKLLQLLKVCRCTSTSLN